MAKLIIYQVFPRYFGNNRRNPVSNGDIEVNGTGKFNDFSAKALNAIKELGVTHIWYTGVLEHATQTDYSSYGIKSDPPELIKGKAGSPYAVKDYYDVSPDLAVSVPDRIKEFKNLLRRTRQAGLKTIIDFVPNHLARTYCSDMAPNGVEDFGSRDRRDKAFSPANNFYYLPGQSFRPPQEALIPGRKVQYTEKPAKVTGNDCFKAQPSVNDWYETIKLNYGVDYQGGNLTYFDPVPDTWHKMKAVLEYWVKLGVDGFRCDMAEMVPLEFWAWVIPQIKKIKEVLFVGEVYNPGLYESFIRRGGFDYLYDKVGLYDTLRNVICEYAPTSAISDCWKRVGPLQDRMLNFLENHDEQRIASDFFAQDPRKALPALIVSACMRNNPFMLYSGQELGEKGMYQEGFSGLDGRSSIFDYWCIDSLADWNNRGRFDGALLSAEQKELRSNYAKMLNLCSQEPALYRGLFFDLMYVNMDNPYFDFSRQFAFLRKADRELLLIVVNFDAESKHIRLRIPEHAFEYLRIKPQKQWLGRDLLSGEELPFELNTQEPLPMMLPAQYGRIWKYRMEDRE